MLVIPATQEAEIKKFSKTPILTKKLGVVVHVCHPSYTGKYK
jgi:hypothetical protein